MYIYYAHLNPNYQLYMVDFIPLLKIRKLKSKNKQLAPSHKK